MHFISASVETLHIFHITTLVVIHTIHLRDAEHAPASHTIISLTITFPFFRSPDPAHGVALITPGNNRSGSAMGWVGFPFLSAPISKSRGSERGIPLKLKALRERAPNGVISVPPVSLAGRDRDLCCSRVVPR